MRFSVLSAISATLFSVLAFASGASAHVLDAETDEYIIPDQVSILSVTHGGSGCPGGSVGASFSPDYQALTLIFDEYSAAVGPDVENPRKRLFCHIVLQLGFPAGMSFSLVDLTYTGWADLEPGLHAAQKSTYYFQGFQKDDRFSFKTRVYGPYLGDFERTDTLAMYSWSPCDKTRGLNIVTSVELNNKLNKSGAGEITLESIDSQVIEKYGVRWRRCSDT